MNSAVLGIDPGVEGGLAVVRGDATIAHLRPFRPAWTEAEFVGAVELGLKILAAEDSRIVYMELVGHMTGDGAKGSNTFGRVDGLLRGALIAFGYRPQLVRPMLWQASMECMTGGNKNISKRRAQELWPAEKWTHYVADAALIAEYGRRRCGL